MPQEVDKDELRRAIMDTGFARGQESPLCDALLKQFTISIKEKGAPKTKIQEAAEKGYADQGPK